MVVDGMDLGLSTGRKMKCHRALMLGVCDGPWGRAGWRGGETLGQWDQREECLKGFRSRPEQRGG